MHVNMVLGCSLQTKSCRAMEDVAVQFSCAALSRHTMFSLGVMLPLPRGKQSWKQFGGFLLGSGCVWMHCQLRRYPSCWNNLLKHVLHIYPWVREWLLITYVGRKHGPVLVQHHDAGPVRHTIHMSDSLISDQKMCSSKPLTWLILTASGGRHHIQATSIYSRALLKYRFEVRVLYWGVPFVCYFTQFRGNFVSFTQRQSAVLITCMSLWKIYYRFNKFYW